MKTFSRIAAFMLFFSLLVNCQKQDIAPLHESPGGSVMQSAFKSGQDSDHAIFLQSLIAQIQELGLNKGNTNALISKIQNAIKSLDQGNTKAAAGKLGAFINQVKDFESEAKLTTEQAQALIEAATKAIDGNFDLWNPGEPFTDPRDQNIYPTVVIGDQCWMAQNLAYLPSVNAAERDYINPAYYVLDYDGTSVSEAKASNNYKIYGVLYNHFAARIVCPDGWHLPTDTEWTILEQTVEAFDQIDNNVALQLKSNAGWNWLNGNNESGFNAKPSGNFNFGFNFQDSYYWAAEENGNTWNRGILGWTQAVSRSNFIPSAGFSVRCIKN